MSSFLTKITSKIKPGFLSGLVKFLWIGFITGILVFILFVYSVSVNLFNLYGALPSYAMLENPENENNLASELYASDGYLLGKYWRENRSQVDYDHLSPNLINALIATEDIRFDEHSGLDLRGLARVLVKSLLLGQDAGGGSTLSQQLAKNLFKTRSQESEGTLSNVPLLGMLIIKTKEWIVAVQLEKNYTKKEILSMYLNTSEFGSNAYGIKVAAETFFNKAPDSLDVQEAAVLVGLLKAPTRYSPVYNEENSLRRRNTVLAQMSKYDYLPETYKDSIQSLPLELEYNVESHNQGLATYFRTVVQNWLLDWTKENGYDLFADGLKIYTTLDSRMQEYAESAVKDHMKTLQAKFFNHWEGEGNPWIDEKGKEMPNFIEEQAKRTSRYRALVQRFGKNSDSVDIIMNRPYKMKVFSWNGEIDTLLSPIDSIKYYKHFLHAGFMAMDPQSGNIKAWVGGINHKYFKYDHVMQGKRQPGSTFKPIVYTAAIDNFYSPCYPVVDAPVTFHMPGQDPPTWTPNNADGKYSGETLTIRQAMARSVNSATAFVMKKIGPETVVNYARKLGISSHLEAVPSLCLGSGGEVSIYEMLGAYSTFVNLGTYIKPRFITRIEDRYGNILFQFPPFNRQVLSEQTAFLMLHMLMGATQEQGGTAMGLSHSLRDENEIGAKTGTTQNYSDGWFMGVTKNLVAGAWVGGDDRSIHFRTLALGQGARTAMPIWEEFFLKVYEDEELGIEKGPFQRPDGSLSLEIDCEKYNNPARFVNQDTSENAEPVREFGIQDEEYF